MGSLAVFLTYSPGLLRLLARGALAPVRLDRVAVAEALLLGPDQWEARMRSRDTPLTNHSSPESAQLRRVARGGVVGRGHRRAHPPLAAAPAHLTTQKYLVVGVKISGTRAK